MKIKLIPIITTASIMLLSPITFAAISSDSDSVDAKIQQLNQQTQNLMAEVKQLRQQISALKASKTTKIERKIITTTQMVAKSDDSSMPILGVTVTTFPFGHTPEHFNITDLPVYNDGVNQDLWLLHQRQKPYTAYHAVEKVAPNHPTVQLSGRIEGQVITANPYHGHRTSDIDLTGAELNVVPSFNDWTTGLLSFTYDNSATNPLRTANSRVQLRRAFITVGNLCKSPLYMTLGQLYVPFGQYISNMVSPPFTMTMGRVIDRALVLGYNQGGLYSALYTFRGDSAINPNHDKVNNIGFNLGYNYNGQTWDSDVGFGVIANIADAEGMQTTGASSPAFHGFAATAATNTLQHRVPGASIHGNLNRGPFHFIAEYVGATKPFNPMDMTFNTHGAKPQALNLEGAYSFTLLDKPANFALGYGKSIQALALNFPEQRYIATLSSKILENLIASLEYRHERNYGTGNTASGAGLADPNSVNGTLGGSRDQVTFQLGAYF